MIERDAFINSFLEELEDNIQVVDSSTIILKKDQENEEELKKLMRALHTIKGSSRMLKFNNIEKIAHGMENVFKGVKEERYSVNNNLVQLVFITTDYLRHAVNQIKQSNSDEFNIERLVSTFEKAYANEPYTIDDLRLVSDSAEEESYEESAEPSEQKTDESTPEEVEASDQIDEEYTEEQEDQQTEEELPSDTQADTQETTIEETKEEAAEQDEELLAQDSIEESADEADISAHDTEEEIPEKPDEEEIPAEPVQEKEPEPKPKPKAVKKDDSKKHQITDEMQTIRINLEHIDSIIQSMNELIIKQFQFKRDYELIGELENRFNKLQELLDPIKQHEKEASVEIGTIEGEILKDLAKIKKNFSEQINLIERNTFELQEQVFSLRMFPLGLILDNLGKMVMETSIKLGKEIDFSIKGKDVRVDKMILERINDPIIHIVRNSIDHGIETPEERKSKGKPEEGQLEINCYGEGGNIIIEITDDGRGIDFEKVRRKAIDMNPDMEEELRRASESDLTSYVFMSGFSTKAKVTDLSGRGVGLDIVRHNIEKIKGKITVQSHRNQGTKFKLTLPLSLATVGGYFITCSNKKFLIPANFVKEIIIIREEDKLDMLQSKAFKLRDKIIPIYYLHHLVDMDGGEKTSDKNYVVIVESLGEMIGLIVDSIIEYASLIYKPAPKNLLKLKSIQGIVFDETFSIVNILFIPEIINKFKSLRSIDFKKRYSDDIKNYKSILVVDDSLTTREIEKSILELENYHVDTAVDGIDGLEKIRNQDFNLIITDISMPRMDGITFIENLRREEKYRNIPVIVITSHKKEKYEEKINQLHVDKYIVKSDFDRNNLISVVSELI